MFDILLSEIPTNEEIHKESTKKLREALYCYQKEVFKPVIENYPVTTDEMEMLKTNFVNAVTMYHRRTGLSVFNCNIILKIKKYEIENV